MTPTRRAPKIVVLGGGTGSFVLLQALKQYTKNVTALVNMADDGGSTGSLRDELGVLPPGDARQCLVALSDSPKVRELFGYRFEEGALKGHALGNLFLAALEKKTGSFAEAIETAAEVLRITGQVIPATLDNVRLKMGWADEQVILDGEGVIDVEHFKHDPRKAHLSLVPAAKANPSAIAAIKEADLVVIAPGDLYTSLGPLLVVNGFREALEKTKAEVAYICNLVTKKGQTDGFDVPAHAAEIERFVGAPIIDVVFYNTAAPARQLVQKYAAEQGELVQQGNIAQQHYRAIGGAFLADTVADEKTKGDPLAVHRTFIRHDGDRITQALLKLIKE